MSSDWTIEQGSECSGHWSNRRAPIAWSATPIRRDFEMEIAGQTVVVTGASRGLGTSLVEALLARGAAKVYATARNGSRASTDARVVRLTLELDDRTTIADAARAADDATIVINNAGTAAFAG